MSYAYVISKLRTARQCVEQAVSDLPDNQSREDDISGMCDEINSRISEVQSLVQGERDEAVRDL
jgi:hypothetical protein